MTLVQKEVKAVYKGSTLVRPNNGSYTPNSNTILYVPLKSDLLDHSGNNISFTNSGVTVADGVGVFNQNYMYTSSISVPDNTKFTAICWARRTANPGSSQYTIFQQQTDQNYNYRGWKAFFHTSSNNYIIKFEGMTVDGTLNSISSVLNQWYCVAYVRNGINDIRTYVDGVLYNTGTLASGKEYLPNWFSIGGEKWYYSSGGARLTGNVSDVIMENKAWTATEISNYYNLTKGNYVS